MEAENAQICNQQAVQPEEPMMLSSSLISNPKQEKTDVLAQTARQKERIFLPSFLFKVIFLE